MSSFDEYKNRYKTARMERRDGVLQVTLHTDGQSLRWGSFRTASYRKRFTTSGPTARTGSSS